MVAVGGFWKVEGYLGEGVVVEPFDELYADDVEDFFPVAVIELVGCVYFDFDEVVFAVSKDFISGIVAVEFRMVTLFDGFHISIISRKSRVV